jgi:hypothetical protein
LFLHEFVFVVGCGLIAAESKYDIILVVAFSKTFLLDEGMLWVFLFEFGLVGILGHCWLVAADCEVAVSVSVRLGKGGRLLGVLLSIF